MGCTSSGRMKRNVWSIGSAVTDLKRNYCILRRSCETSFGYTVNPLLKTVASPPPASPGTGGADAKLRYGSTEIALSLLPGKMCFSTARGRAFREPASSKNAVERSIAFYG